jgi:hypothetical protein
MLSIINKAIVSKGKKSKDWVSIDKNYIRFYCSGKENKTGRIWSQSEYDSNRWHQFHWTLEFRSFQWGNPYSSMYWQTAMPFPKTD